MSANEKQIGGEHYRAPVQHWDWVTDNEICYLGGCATKYATRWENKNGRQDLEKADHYVEKMIEKVRAGELRPGPYVGMMANLPAPVAAFAEANGLCEVEARLCEIIATWADVEDLQEARAAIRELMVKCDQLDLFGEGN